jgi:LPS sulfotransferase NodH
VPAITHSYLICTTPRTGSNFLCEVLRSSGSAGSPDDYFWNQPFWYELWTVSTFSAYLKRLLQEGTSTNGVFGCKMMWDYLGDLLPQLAAHAGTKMTTPEDILAATFPNLRYVWLTRQDKVRQGISYYRALETRIWRSTDRGTKPVEDPPFNAQAIESLVQLCTWEDQEWRDFFGRSGITPLVITYEDLAASPERAVADIVAFLGLPPAPSLQGQVWAHQRQADALTERWVHRYLAEMYTTPEEG